MIVKKNFQGRCSSNATKIKLEQAKEYKLAKVAGGQGVGGQGASMRTQNMYACFDEIGNVY